MATNYVQEGDTLDWLNDTGATVASGGVVKIGSNGDAMLGIAKTTIRDGETGAVALNGVFDVIKVTASVIAQGEYVMWDSSARKFDNNAATPAAGDVSNGAIAWESKGNGETHIHVKLTGVPGVLA